MLSAVLSGGCFPGVGVLSRGSWCCPGGGAVKGRVVLSGEGGAVHNSK